MSDRAVPNIDVTRRDDQLTVFECLVAAEEKRRANQRQDIVIDLSDFERNYYGPEVGFIRRSFNSILLAKLKLGGDILDYGSGGVWWKSDYWPLFNQVVAVEVDRSALDEIGKKYPEVVRWYTRNGIVESTRRFDVILSSSVLGYILPVQADHHISSCAELLKEGGQLVITRVLAFNIWAVLRSKRLVDVEGTSFAYHYTKSELTGLLEKHGFKNIHYIPLGIRAPILSWKMNQTLYRLFPRLMGRWLPRLFPYLKIQHMAVAQK